MGNSHQTRESWRKYGTPPLPQPPLPAPPLCQHTCIDVLKATAAAADGDGRNNAANVDGDYPPAVGKNNVIASIRANHPLPQRGTPTLLLHQCASVGGIHFDAPLDTAAVPLCCSAPQTWHDFKLQHDNQQELGVRDEITMSRGCQGPVLGQQQPPTSSVPIKEHPLL